MKSNDGFIEQRISYLAQLGVFRVASLSEKISDHKSRCNICLRRCVISEGKYGFCRTIVNWNGALYTTIYGAVCSANADPIEKKPVYHFKPASKVFSVGTFGCNFRCVFCQNWQIAYEDLLSDANQFEFVSPDALVKAAIECKCQGISWTYNEPAIWIDYINDCAKLAKENGLYTVFVTNGYSTPEAMSVISRHMDVYRVDIKSMDDYFYQQLANISDSSGIRENAVLAKKKYGMHVECVTNIIPNWNDSTENISATAEWIAKELGVDTPWHITRFYPYGKLSEIPPTPIETLNRAYNIAKSKGLHFVYLGNVISDWGQNTCCPKCNSTVIERKGYIVKIAAVTSDGKCANDGMDLNIKM